MTRKKNSAKLSENIPVSHLTKEWTNKERFLFDMASTDHKLFYSDKGARRSVAILGRVIAVTHQLPGYFMCIDSDIISEPYLNLKKDGNSFMLEGLKKIVTYISAAAVAAERHNITREVVLIFAKSIGVTDPAVSDFKIEMGEKIEEKLPPKK